MVQESGYLKESVTHKCLIQRKLMHRCVISDFRRGVNEIFAQICVLLGHYAISSGNPLQTFHDIAPILFFFLGLLDP